MKPLPPPSGDMEKRLHEMMNNEDAVGLGLCSAGFYKSLQQDLSAIASYISALEADLHERKERNREGIEKMFAAMNKLDTPKRGELHLLLISLFS